MIAGSVPPSTAARGASACEISAAPLAIARFDGRLCLLARPTAAHAVAIVDLDEHRIVALRRLAAVEERFTDQNDIRSKLHRALTDGRVLSWFGRTAWNGRP
jgi:hypothetical protein